MMNKNQRSHYGIIAVVSAIIMLVIGWFNLEGAELNIQPANPDWDYFMGLLWAVVILASISLWPVSKQHKKVLFALWFARIGVTLGFMLLYEAHYGLDAYMYYHRGLLEANPIGLMGFGSGTENMIALAGLHNLIIPESYHALKVTWALVGFLGVYAFYRAACIFMGRDDISLFYLLGLFPSILFWGSIFGKDPLTLFGIGLYSYGVVGFIIRQRPTYLLPLVLGVILAAWIRIWLAVIMFAPLSVFFLFGRQNIIRKVLFIVVTVPLFFYSLEIFNERFNIETTQDLVQQTDTLSQNWAIGGSGQKIEGGFKTPLSMLAFAPVGAFTALFRPLPGELFNLFGLLASLENAFILGCLVLASIRGRWRRLGNPILLWATALLLVWSVIYGFVSYQNLGAAFRFRLQVSPVLLMVVLYLVQRHLVPLPVGSSPYGKPFIRGQSFAASPTKYPFR